MTPRATACLEMIAVELRRLEPSEREAIVASLVARFARTSEAHAHAPAPQGQRGDR